MPAILEIRIAGVRLISKACKNNDIGRSGNNRYKLNIGKVSYALIIGKDSIYGLLILMGADAGNLLSLAIYFA